jgi:hypothetical protein
MGRENGVWWFLTLYPADLDPLDGTPQHVLQNLPDTHQKDPSAWFLRGLGGCHIRGMSECDLRETYDVRSGLGFVGCW